MLSSSAMNSKVRLGYGFENRQLMYMPAVTRYADPNGVFDELLNWSAFSPSEINPRAILPDVTRMQPLSDQAKRALIARPDTPDAALIEVIPTPTALHHQAWLADRASTPEELARELNRLSVIGRTYGGEYITRNTTRPGRIGAVIDPRTGRVAGTHTDSRDGLPHDLKLGFSRRRLGSVIGAPRRLNFCLPDVVTMKSELGKSSALWPTDQTYNNVLDEYIHVFPERAVIVSTIVEEGFSWLTPTDNIGHDGATPEGYSSIYLFLGYWKRVNPAHPELPLAYA